MKSLNTVKLFTIGFVLFLAPALSAKNLFEGRWVEEPVSAEEHKSFGFEMTIKASSLDGGMFGPGGRKFTASCKVEGSSLNYTITSKDHLDEVLDSPQKKGVCKIEKINDNLYFQERLNCTGPIGNFLKQYANARTAYRSLLPEGTARKIQGQETYSILKIGKVNDAAYLRSAPNATAKPLICKIFTPDDRLEHEGPVIPKGKELFVIGRTKTKVKVQKWENYWYYINTNNGMGNCGPGWVYGEFVTIQ